MSVETGISLAALSFALWGLPLYFLLLYPFRDDAVISPRRVGASLAVIFLLTLAFMTQALIFSQGDDGLPRRAFFLLNLVAGAVFMSYNVNASGARRWFVLLLAQCFIGFCNAFAMLLRLALAEIGFITQYVTGKIFAHLFVLLAVVPLYVYFTDARLTPFWNVRANEEEEVRLWQFPCVFFVIFALTLNYWSEQHTENLDDIFLWNVVFLGQALGTFLSCDVLVAFLTETHQRQHAQEELRQAEFLAATQRNEYERLQNTIEMTRRLRHDLRQQLVIIAGMAAEGDLEELRQFLREYRQETDIDSSTSLSDNFIAASLLEYYQSLAQESGVTFTHHAPLPQKLPLPDFEWATVLGNLLANALEACRAQESGERFIDVRALMPTEKTLAVIVRNSYDGELYREGELFVSRKREGRQTGLGIASVRAVAEKHSGVAMFGGEKHIFTAKVLLNFP